MITWCCCYAFYASYECECARVCICWRWFVIVICCCCHVMCYVNSERTNEVTNNFFWGVCVCVHDVLQVCSSPPEIGLNEINAIGKHQHSIEWLSVFFYTQNSSQHSQPQPHVTKLLKRCAQVCFTNAIHYSFRARWKHPYNVVFG